MENKNHVFNEAEMRKSLRLDTLCLCICSCYLNNIKNLVCVLGEELRSVSYIIAKEGIVSREITREGHFESV